MNEQSFYFTAMVYLAAAVICVPLSKKIGLGSVLGYLLAGIIIGPAFLGLAGDDQQDLMHIAEFGVVMMLFVVGLELEPDLLWKLRSSILGMGGLQVLLSSIVLGAAAVMCGLVWQAALAVGLILSMSSTAIVIQTLNEKGLMKSAAGRSAFSVLLFQDIAVIPMLAVLPLLATYAGTPSDTEVAHTWVAGKPGWLQTLIVLGTVGSITIAGKYLIRHLFRIIAQTHLREVFTASTLLLVVGIAELMTFVGLSPALGTFLAGVVLADSEYRHELESDIEPFKGLLLGLFFVAVGSSIDFNLVVKQPGQILGLVALLMVLKIGVLSLVGRFFKLGLDQNVLLALALSQTGEFAFVLLSFSLENGVLRADQVSILVAVVALSMAFTPILMIINERLVQPYLGTRRVETEREADNVDERHPVIIAGFGRYGNIVGRFLRANNVKTTILDIDSDRVDVLRKLGFNVYYGDATRQELLMAAGAQQAKLLIVALGDTEKTLQMVATCKKHFPNLRLLVRAYDRPDTYDLLDAGMLHIYRETLDSSLRMGVDALRLLGQRHYKAKRAARTFLKYDEAAMKRLAAVRHDNKEYFVSAKEFIYELENIIRNDLNQANFKKDEGWDEESMIAEAKRLEENK